jgi:urease accessory protein
VTITAWQGRLQLSFSQGPKGTQINHAQATAPLKIQRPFYPEGAEVCHSVILHTAGGVVGGDRLNLDIELESDTHALITTAAASKLYRSNGLDAIQTVHIQIRTGASLEWLPQETIVFNGANYRQHIRVDLEPGATLLIWDITRFGRSARGERFLEGNWRSRTDIWQQGKPLWIDAQQIQGDQALIDSPNGLAGYPVMGSFALVGHTASCDWVEKARALWEGDLHHAEFGVTRLLSGMLCRYRGHSTQEARQWFTAVWNLLRLSLLGRPVCPIRVWPL